MVKNKSALITGASSGIGREMAKQLSTQCEKILICGRNESELNITKEQMLKIEPRIKVETFVGDLTSETSRDRLIQQASTANVDLAILNAGGGDFSLFKNSNWPTSEKMIHLNIEAPVHLSHGLLPHLLENASPQSPSALVFVSSHAGFMHIPHFAVYASCKRFLNAFSQTLSQEHSEDPIHIMVSCPGATRTHFSNRAGLPTKMLSTPAEPADVARKILNSIGHRRFHIVESFDKILLLAQKILPVAFFDKVVSRLQRKLLKQADHNEPPSQIEKQEGA